MVNSAWWVRGTMCVSPASSSQCPELTWARGLRQDEVYMASRVMECMESRLRASPGGARPGTLQPLDAEDVAPQGSVP